MCTLKHSLCGYTVFILFPFDKISYSGCLWVNNKIRMYIIMLIHKKQLCYIIKGVRCEMETIIKIP